MRAGLIPSFLCLVTAAVAVASETHIKWEDISREMAHFRQWETLTSEAYKVDPKTAMLCSGPKNLGTQGPHKEAWIHVYMNALASAAQKEGGDYLPGSIIIKEKWNKDHATGDIGGMVKQEAGFAPENGDWEYFYGKPGGPYQREEMSHCASCHNNAPGGQRVFGR